MLNPHISYGSISTTELGSDETFQLKGLGYTPITNVTSQIMEEVAQELRKSLGSCSIFLNIKCELNIYTGLCQSVGNMRYVYLYLIFI